MFDAIPEDESDVLSDKWVIPRPGKPLFQAATVNFSRHAEAAVNTKNATRGPLLLIAGGEDHTVPDAITKSTFKRYRKSEATTEIVEFDDRTLANDRPRLAGDRRRMPHLAPRQGALGIDLPSTVAR